MGTLETLFLFLRCLGTTGINDLIAPWALSNKRAVVGYLKVDEALLEQQQQAYAVEGVDDTADTAQMRKKRKKADAEVEDDQVRFHYYDMSPAVTHTLFAHIEC